MHWVQVAADDPRAVLLADRHYTRRPSRRGQPWFMPPGRSVVLLAAGAVWGWHRNDPGFAPQNGLDGWTCTMFRNESPVLSSLLILEAEAFLDPADIGPAGLLTYVRDARVRSPNPGYCFKMAGWHAAGRSADGRKTLLRKAAATYRGAMMLTEARTDAP